MLEITPDGMLRFRVVVVMVGRQSGKTYFMRNLALWSMFVNGAKLVLSVAQSVDIAREAWRSGIEVIQGTPGLDDELERVSRVNGDEFLRLVNGHRWKIGAANRSAGRGLAVDLMLLDELREHRSWDAWAALSKTILARPNSLTVGISNAGDDESVVLYPLRSAALAGENPTMGLFEWSAPDGCDLDDRQAWAQAEPGLGHTITEQAIATAMATDPPAVFRTEVLCQRVLSLQDHPIPDEAWAACLDAAMTLDSLRARTVLVLDMSPDMEHITLARAAVDSTGRVRIDIRAAWTNTRTAIEELPAMCAGVRRRWSMPGPAAALRSDLAKLRFKPISPADSATACQELAELVSSRRIIHNGDPLLAAHVTGAVAIPVGDGWRFERRGGVGHVDAAYAAAGAANAARSIRSSASIQLIRASTPDSKKSSE